MNNIIDQTNDPGFSNLRVLVEQFPELREMSKTASLDPNEFAELPDTAFAWPAKRQFPIHNREHAALSLGYSKTASGLPTDVQTSLSKAAEVYGISADAFAAPKSLTKIANNEIWLLAEKKRFRVASSEDVKVAEKVVLEKYASLSIEDRAEAFLNLKRAASQFQTRLLPCTEKLAGFTVTSTQTFKDWVEAREEASRKLGSALAPAFAKLAEAYSGTAPFITDRPTQIKLAQLVHALDKKAGLTKYYGKKLPDPIQTVFNTTKLAADMVNVGGINFDSATLGEIPLTFWEDALGADVAKEIAPTGVVDPTLLKQLLPTLPNDLKMAVGKQLGAYAAK